MTDWPQIVREHGPLVWRTACRLLNHDADAADCFQFTFLAALKVAGPVRHWPAVLVRLATARALDMLRVRYREAQRHTPLTAEPAGADDPVERAAAGELAERLRAALAAIDRRQSEVFCLVCLDGRSNQDVAELLNLSAAHVGMLLHRARAALRERLNRYHPARERSS
jgi:RNA polymerase sigma-70 factor (ECF subfamily)